MSFFTRLVKDRRSRDAAARSLNTSADSSPASAPISVQNSAGTSRTSAEIIPYLQHAFEDFDSAESIDKNFVSLKFRIGERISHYSNVGFPSMPECEWEAPATVEKLMQIAVECAVNVYDTPDSVPSNSKFAFSLVKSISASLGAVTKATKILEVHSNYQTQESALESVLVVSVRGTVTASLDWSVNLNIGTTNGGEIGEIVNDDTIKIHSGFLSGAKKLLPLIEEQLVKARSTPHQHVLFTGHSAGGAIASLLFIMILGQAKIRYPEFRFSLITFGAPPITSRLLTPQLNRLVEGLPNPGVVLAVINEHDPVSRLDSSYVQSIIDLYDAGTGSLSGNIAPSRGLWALPPPDLYLVGDLIILKDNKLENKDDSTVHAYHVTPAVLSQQIFCDPRMHKKDTYLQRVQQLMRQGHILLS